MKLKKIISWNVNGIRACAQKGLLDFLAKEKPDVLALQEIKASEKQLSDEVLNPEGYDLVLFPATKSGYSGTAVYIKKSLKCNIKKGLGIEEFDIEGRLITVELGDFVFVSAYFPNSQDERKRLSFKLSFCSALKKYVDALDKKGKSLLVSGDYNIAHKEIDITNPAAHVNNPGFLPEERAWMDLFLSSNYIDTFRMFTKEGGNYTWWSYRARARERNSGWRLDYHCVNKRLRDRVVKSYHNSEVMGSDHCPVTIILK